MTSEGWVCPLCRRVYAPWAPTCWYCEPALTTGTSTTTVASIPTVFGASPLAGGGLTVTMTATRAPSPPDRQRAPDGSPGERA